MTVIKKIMTMLAVQDSRSRSISISTDSLSFYTRTWVFYLDLGIFEFLCQNNINLGVLWVNCEGHIHLICISIFFFFIKQLNLA